MMSKMVKKENQDIRDGKTGKLRRKRQSNMASEMVKKAQYHFRDGKTGKL